MFELFYFFNKNKKRVVKTRHFIFKMECHKKSLAKQGSLNFLKDPETIPIAIGTGLNN